MRSLARALLFAAAVAFVPASAADELLVYVGTYTGAGSKGIYVSRLNLATGALSAPVLAAETSNPSFLAVRPQRDVLYAVNEVDTFGGQPTGSVSAFAIDRGTGLLKPLNQQGSGGAGPAHLTVDGGGRNVLVANYGGGSVAVLPIERDGRLGAARSIVRHRGSSVNPERQREPHAHQIIVDPRGRFAYAADLGIDRVMIYRFDAAAGTLAAADPPSAALAPGAGPRHAVIDAAGRFVYVINELTCTITAFGIDRTSGALSEVQTVSTLPAGTAVQRGYSTAEIALAPSGAFLYGSNRGHDSIAVFAVDRSSGRLTAVAHTPAGGRTPRGFAIEPGGAYLLAAHQNSDSVAVFRIDRAAGTLTPAGAPIAVGKPVDVKFVRP